MIEQGKEAVQMAATAGSEPEAGQEQRTPFWSPMREAGPQLFSPASVTFPGTTVKAELKAEPQRLEPALQYEMLALQVVASGGLTHWATVPTL